MRHNQPYAALAIAVLLAAPTAALADSGFYIGVGAGGATLEADLGPSVFPTLPSEIDEDDTAIKIFGGYNLDLPVVTLGVEAAYADFGEPDIDIAGDLLLVDTTAFTLWGTAGIDVGPVDVYGKLGAIMWDSDAEFQGFSSSADGTDTAYGLGARFAIGSLELRGEYELYDIDGGDLSMLSLGVAYRF
ncbi:MAG: outer membrane beta-barrel protein [Woeseiaceae bacterium]|nr:outer membrane beta-barrel protein [Woeseiaceae bacterium]